MIDMATELENTVRACYSEQWESLLTVRHTQGNHESLVRHRGVVEALLVLLVLLVPFLWPRVRAWGNGRTL